jgi:hypothetical protein
LLLALLLLLHSAGGVDDGAALCLDNWGEWHRLQY